MIDDTESPPPSHSTGFPPPARPSGTGPPPGDPYGPPAGLDPHDPRGEERRTAIRFARLIGLLGLAVLGAAAFLLALPMLVDGSVVVYLIAYATVSLFGPVGFMLLGQSYRIHNRAVHGTPIPDRHRRVLRIMGGALIATGALLAFGGFGVSGPLSRALNLLWGIALALYGARMIARSILADRE